MILIQVTYFRSYLEAWMQAENLLIQIAPWEIFPPQKIFQQNLTLTQQLLHSLRAMRSLLTTKIRRRRILKPHNYHLAFFLQLSHPKSRLRPRINQKRPSFMVDNPAACLHDPQGQRCVVIFVLSITFHLNFKFFSDQDNHDKGGNASAHPSHTKQKAACSVFQSPTSC
jgi:hypothetical protein